MHIICMYSYPTHKGDRHDFKNVMVDIDCVSHLHQVYNYVCLALHVCYVCISALSLIKQVLFLFTL